MPSIPQSLLWISLVVLWLFVLVPMLISKRDTVRRTSDVALSTRVLNSGKSRLSKRRGPATGHRHDPDWAPAGGGFDNLDHGDEAAASRSRGQSVVVVDRAAEDAQSDYLDVDIVDEDSGALPVGGREVPVAEAAQPSLFDSGLFDSADESDTLVQPKIEIDPESDDESVDLFEEDIDVDSRAAVETPDVDLDEVADADPADEKPVASPRTSRPRQYESATAVAVSARKYQFRKRVLMAMAAILIFTAVLSFTVDPGMWWLCGSVGAVTVLYLAYLRRQTRIEAQVRRRRQQRMSRSRLGVENTRDREYAVVPSRLRRPGAAVLEIDDEDPSFEHLDEVAFARHYDLPRAAGQ